MSCHRHTSDHGAQQTGACTARLALAASALLIVVAAILFPSPGVAQFPEPVRLAAFYYPPFYTRDGSDVGGIAVDLGRELFRRMDTHSEVTMYPLKRALAHLKHGDLDAVMILIKTEKRSRYLAYTRPVLTVRGLIWSLHQPVNFDTLDDLRRYKIGVTQGYSYGEELDTLLPSMRVEVANTDYHNYLKLLERRIDIFPGNEIVAKGLFKLHPRLQGRFKHSDKSFIEWELHMAISKKSKYVKKIPQINRILSEMEQEGFIDRTVRKYTE